MKELIYLQSKELNSHWIWAAMNRILLIGRKYNKSVNYFSEKDDNGYYTLHIKIPENDLIEEVIDLYVKLNLPEFKRM